MEDAGRLQRRATLGLHRTVLKFYAHGRKGFMCSGTDIFSMHGLRWYGTKGVFSKGLKKNSSISSGRLSDAYLSASSKAHNDIFSCTLDVSIKGLRCHLILKIRNLQ